MVRPEIGRSEVKSRHKYLLFLILWLCARVSTFGAVHYQAREFSRNILVAELACVDIVCQPVPVLHYPVKPESLSEIGDVLPSLFVVVTKLSETKASDWNVVTHNNPLLMFVSELVAPVFNEIERFIEITKGVVRFGSKDSCWGSATIEGNELNISPLMPQSSAVGEKHPRPLGTGELLGRDNGSFGGHFSGISRTETHPNLLLEASQGEQASNACQQS